MRVPSQYLDQKIATELAAELRPLLRAEVQGFAFLNERWICLNEPDTPSRITVGDVQEVLKHFDHDSTSVQQYSNGVATAYTLRTNETLYCPVAICTLVSGSDSHLISALMSTKLEAILNRRSSAQCQYETQAYIEQVTQDFEELTWLRDAHEKLDIRHSYNSEESVTHDCLASLARVVRAQDILLVTPAQLEEFQRTSSTVVSLTSCKVPSEAINLRLRFLDQVQHQSLCSMLVINAKPYTRYIEGFEGLRNCVVIPVAKSGQLYGWLVTSNKLTEDGNHPPADAHLVETNSYQFGTFEAGMLGTAANLLASHARNVELFDAQEALTIGIIRAIINAIDAKDPYTCGHSDRVAQFAKSIAERIGIKPSECERIYMAGLLHDVGKIGIPDAILQKPGKLTTEEFNVVKKHPEIGFAILKHLKQLDYVLPGVLHHHEAMDGTGYPHGLQGENIPLAGRILAVADAYDAMTSNRPYRNGMPSEKAESILSEGAGKTWDARMVQGLFECIADGTISSTIHATVPAQPNEATVDVYSSAILMDRIASAINSMTTA